MCVCMSVCLCVVYVCMCSKPDIIIKTNKNKCFFSGRDKYIVLGLSNSWGAGRQVTIPYEIGE